MFLNKGLSLVVALMTVIVLITTRVEGQCSDSDAQQCLVSLFFPYSDRIHDLDFAFNRAQLAELCGAVKYVGECLTGKNCTFGETSTSRYKLQWQAIIGLTSNICFNGKEEYLSHELCFEKTDVKKATSSCITATTSALPDIDPMLSPYYCRFNQAKYFCIETAYLRNCGQNSTDYFKSLILPVLQTLSDCNISAPQEGVCNDTSFQLCTQQLRGYNFDVLQSSIKKFNSLSDFNNICRFTDWVSECLKTYGCEASAALTSRWTRFRTPLLELCYPLNKDVVPLFPGGPCSNKGQCLSAGLTAVYISQCPNGFTLDVSHTNCTDVNNGASRLISRISLVITVLINSIRKFIS